MPGYPITTSFKTPKEVNAYLDADRITCLRCGKAYKALGTHLRVHSWTESEYREYYGLPWTRGLISTGTRVLMKAAGDKLVADGKAFGGRENYGAFADKARATARRKHQPYRRLVAAANVAKTPTRDKNRVLTGEFKVWKDADYWKIPDRMAEQDRTVREVCGDDDMPGPSAMRVFARANPKYQNALDDAEGKLSLAALRRAQRLGKRFKAAASDLRSRGLTGKQIAEELGVHVVTVEKHISGVPVPEKSHCPNGHPYPESQMGGPKRCRQCNTEASRRSHGHMERSEAAKIQIEVPCSFCGKPVLRSLLRGKSGKARCEDCYVIYRQKYNLQKSKANK
jgi:hypothetical protein